MYGCIWKRKRKSRRNPNAHFSEAEGPPTPKSALATPPAAPPATHTARGLRDACLWSGRALTHPLRPLTERGQLGKRDTGKPRHGRPRSRCAPRRSMARRRLRARAPAPRPANILGRRGGGAAGRREILPQLRGGLLDRHAPSDPAPAKLRHHGTSWRPRGQEGEFPGGFKVLSQPSRLRSSQSPEFKSHLSSP